MYTVVPSLLTLDSWLLTLMSPVSCLLTPGIELDSRGPRPLNRPYEPAACNRQVRASADGVLNGQHGPG